MRSLLFSPARFPAGGEILSTNLDRHPTILRHNPLFSKAAIISDRKEVIGTELNNKTPEISLIIPVYNVEKYLRKTLKSVENQTFKDFEVIIINDGSTDNSIEIINEFADRNKKFTVINQDNKGPSEARNKGISISKGNYIAFMDSDDYIEKNFLEVLYKNAIKHEADIVCCNFNFYYPENKLKIYMPLIPLPGIYTGAKALKKLILDISVHHFVWNKLYKRSLFIDKGVRFYDMYFEDIATSPRLFYYAEKVVLLGRALYNYTSRKSSILGNINYKKINDFVSALGTIRNFLENKNVYKKYKNHIWVYSQKTKIVCYYYILQMHTKFSNFDGFLKNISAVNKSIDYFISGKYVPHENIHIPNLICSVKQPVKKHQIKVKKKNGVSPKI
ncbi:MAG: glycosyltransferase [Oscillospiraceae bacterium]|nr:glycosyltransferase [Oscillospiraceae bacterium]